MGFGGQSRGLIIASKTQGWDPTVIPARDGKPAVSIANFNKDPKTPGSYLYDTTGTLPASDGVGNDVVRDTGESFASPDVSRETKNRRRGGDPYAGMGDF